MIFKLSSSINGPKPIHMQIRFCATKEILLKQLCGHVLHFMVRLQAWQKRQNVIVGINLALPKLTQKNNCTNIMHTRTPGTTRGQNTAKLASTSPCTVIIHATVNMCHLRPSVFSSAYPPLSHLKRPKSTLIAAPIFSQTSLYLCLTSTVCVCMCVFAVHRS